MIPEGLSATLARDDRGYDMAALLVSLPFLLWQAYAFVLPAFSPAERRTLLPFLLLMPLLFVAGVAAVALFAGAGRITGQVTDGLGTGLDTYALVLRRSGRLDDALQTELEALRVLGEVGDRHSEGTALVHLAAIYLDLDRTDEALATAEGLGVGVGGAQERRGDEGLEEVEVARRGLVQAREQAVDHAGPERPGEAEVGLAGAGQQPAVPRVARADWGRNAIDAFVLARLEKDGLAPGAVSLHGKSVLVGTGSHAVELTRIQPAGKKMMSAADWARGLASLEGVVFE